MISQFNQLGVQVDGLYATDEELQFIDDYSRSFYLRVQTYQKLQAVESLIVQQVLTRLKDREPSLFEDGTIDLTVKWKRDTVRVLRYSALTMLLNDPNILCDRLLFWFRTVMKAFGTERSCNMTYLVMQDVIKQHLTSSQANLICPILELNRQVLGAV